MSFIGNLAREVAGRTAEAEQEAIYRRYAAGQREMARSVPAEYAAVRPNLRVLLKDETYPGYISLQNEFDLPGGEPTALVFEPVAGDVIACCVEELASGLRFVTASDLVTWSVDAADVMRVAKANVCALGCELHQYPHALGVFADDSFQAARLVNTALFADRPARGHWVGVVPDRDTFFVAESEDLDGLAGLARLVEKQLEEGARLISGVPLVLRDGHWQEFEPPEAVRVPFANGRKLFAASQWADYKSLQEKVFERNGEDVFIASYTLYEEKGAAPVTYWSGAVWSDGVDTILPVVDRIVFVEGEGQPLRVASWDSVVRVMGPAMQRLDGHPARCRVTSFPTSSQFVAMGASVG